MPCHFANLTECVHLEWTGDMDCILAEGYRWPDSLTQWKMSSQVIRYFENVAEGTGTHMPVYEEKYHESNPLKDVSDNFPSPTCFGARCYFCCVDGNLLLRLQPDSSHMIPQI